MTVEIKNLEGKTIYTYRVSDLRCADLCGADLYGADLHGADLDGANLAGADIQGSDLKDARLRDAKLFQTGLCGTDLRGTGLTKEAMKTRGAIFDGKTVFDDDATTPSEDTNETRCPHCGQGMPDSETREKLDLTVLNLHRVQALLYILMRDYMPSGSLVAIINDLVDLRDGETTRPDIYTFTSRHLAEYAEELTKRLVDDRTAG